MTLVERIAHLRDLLARDAAVGFDEVVVEAGDRMTVAVTPFALLELYKQGEASWTQSEPFGEITIRATHAGRHSAAADPQA